MDTKKLDAKVLKTYWNIDKAITKALPLLKISCGIFFPGTFYR